MTLIIIGVLAMAISSVLDTVNTVAEAQFKDKLAAITAAAVATLTILVALVGADQLKTNGTTQTLVYLVAVFLTTLVVTDRAEAWSAKHLKGPTK